MTFGPWEIPETALLDEVKRYDNTKYIAAKNDDGFHMDVETGTTQVYGAEILPYTVSLEECGCSDFRNRGLPCKHMIYVALKLGHKFEVPQFDPQKAADYDIQEDISRLTDRWRSGQLTLDALTKCVTALKSSASKAKRRPGRPKKKA